MPAGYGWSFPAGGEVRIGVGSFDPRFHVKEPTIRLADDLRADTVRYQGNWIPHALRPATEDGVFFVGDSAGHCLPLTAEGIRTALYFGIACGRELRRRDRRPAAARQALARYHRFSAGHAWQFDWMLRVQRLVPRVAAARCSRPRCEAMSAKRFVDWSFEPLPEHRAPVVRARPSTLGLARPASPQRSQPERPERPDAGPAP